VRKCVYLFLTYSSFRSGLGVDPSWLIDFDRPRATAGPSAALGMTVGVGVRLVFGAGGFDSMSGAEARGVETVGFVFCT
jgi:hypothetical protein